MEAQTKLIEKLKELVKHLNIPVNERAWNWLAQRGRLESEIASLDKQIAEGKEGMTINADEICMKCMLPRNCGNCAIYQAKSTLQITTSDVDHLINEASKEIPDKVIYVCSKCGYALTKLEYFTLQHDFGCPKCGTSFNEFKGKEIPAGAEEIYQKVYIKNENDLPKEDGIYLIAKKNNLKTSGLKPKIYTIISKKWWLENVEWYLIKAAKQ